MCRNKKGNQPQREMYAKQIRQAGIAQHFCGAGGTSQRTKERLVQGGVERGGKRKFDCKELKRRGKAVAAREGGRKGGCEGRK